MSSLVSLICSSAQRVGLIQAEVFPISEFLVKTFIRNYHNSSKKSKKSRNRILNAYPKIFSVSLMTTFYLTKAEKPTEKFLTQLS